MAAGRPLAVALLLAAAASARAAEGDDLASLIAAQTREADEVMTLLHDRPGDPGVLAAATALRDQCLRSGNHRSAEFIAGPLCLARPEALEDRHRYVDILLVRGKVDAAIKDLRSLLHDRPSDCRGWEILAEVLLSTGDFEGAMEAHAAHLREHAGEAGPLYRRACIALWNLRDTGRCRDAVDAMRTAAGDPSSGAATADWLRKNADILEKEAAAADADRGILRARSSSLDGWLAAAFAAALLGLAGAFRLTRPRS